MCSLPYMTDKPMLNTGMYRYVGINGQNGTKTNQFVYITVYFIVRAELASVYHV